jgi:hypothetical protein
MKLYFDTNIIFSYFDSLAKNKPIPKIFKHLYNVKDRHEYFVSNLTRVEIFRHLHSLGLSFNDCNNLWRNSFLKILNVKELIIENVDFEYITKMVSERPTKRGMIVNIIHLIFAKENELTILTADKPLKNRFKIFYTKIIDYEEFRKL